MNKSAKTFIQFSVLSLFVIFVILLSIQPSISYTLQENETLVLNRIYNNESNLSVNAIASFHCVWNYPEDGNKTCLPVIEIYNNGTDAVSIGTFSTTFDFTAPNPNYQISDTDNIPSFEYPFNWTCYTSYGNESLCRVNLTTRDYSGTYLDSPSVVIQPDHYGAIQLNFSIDKYSNGNYNFSFVENRSGRTIILDLEISDCSEIISSGYYNLTSDLTSGGDCMLINSDDVIFDGATHKITMTDSGWGVQLGDDSTPFNNITIKNITIIGDSDNSAMGIYFSNSMTNSYLLNSSILNLSNNNQNGYYVRSVSKASTNYPNITISSNRISLYGNKAYGLSLAGRGSYPAGYLVENNIINFSSNSVTGATGKGSAINISYGNNSIFRNNKINFSTTRSDGECYGLELDSSGYHTISGGYIFTRCTTFGTALNSKGPIEANNFSNILFYNDLVGGTGAYIWDIGTANFTNISMLGSGGVSVYSASVSPTAVLNRRWYADVYVNDSDGNNVNSATVTIRDVNGNLVSSSSTNSSGYITQVTLREYKQNGTTAYYFDTNYTFNASKSGYVATAKSINITDNNFGKSIYLTLIPQNPSLSFITPPTPANNSWINKTAINVSISSDMDLFNSTFSFNSVNESMSGNWSKKLWYKNLTGMTDGSFFYKVYGNNTDALWNVSETRQINVDTLIPNISLSSPTPANNSWQSSAIIRINISVNDSNLDSSLAKLYWDGTIYTMSCGSGNTTNCTYYDTSITEGSHWYNATIKDKALNVNRSLTNVINVDYTNPSISSVYPPSGTTTITDRDYVNITFTLTETNPGYIKLNWNGANETLDLVTNCTGTGPYSCTSNRTSLSNGVYGFSIWTNDSANNIGYSTTSYVNISIPNPSINFVSPTPANNSWINISTQTINVSVTSTSYPVDTCFLNWESNNTNYTMNKVQNGNNAYCNYPNFPLNDGTHTYRVYANNTFGLWGVSELRHIKVDTVYPIFSNIYPANVSYFARNWFNLTFTLTETNPNNTNPSWVDFGRLTRTNFTIGCPGGNCIINRTSLDNTNSSYPYSFWIWANDSAGNFNKTGIYDVHIDTNTPSIVFSSDNPSNNTFSANNWLTSNITLDPIENLTGYHANHTYALFFSNGTPYDSQIYTNYSTIINWTGIPESSYLYNVTETNKALTNGSTSTRYFTYDATNPGINFTYPYNESYGTRNINITVNYSEINPSTVFLNLSKGSSHMYFYNYSIVPGSGNITFFVYGLAYGNWTVYVWMNDTSGRTNQTDTRWVFDNATSPIVDIISPGNNLFTKSGSVNFLCNATMSGPIFSELSNISLLTNTTGTWKINQTIDVVGNYNETYFNKTISDGYYVWSCQACDTDDICDTYGLNYSLTIDNSNPSINYSSDTDASGQFTRDYILVNLSSSDSLSGINETILSWTGTNYTSSQLTCTSILDGEYCYKNFSGLSDTNYTTYGWTNDSANNINYTSIRNFWIDAVGPSISITSPTEAETFSTTEFPKTITAQFSITDNVPFVNCFYNVTDQLGNVEVANKTINCNSTSESFGINAVGSYYLNIVGNTSNHKTSSTRFFIVQLGEQGGGGGGGENPPTNETKLFCGDGICSKEVGEDWETCMKDCSQATSLENFLKNNWIWIVLLLLIIITLIVISRKKKIK